MSGTTIPTISENQGMRDVVATHGAEITATKTRGGNDIENATAASAGVSQVEKTTKVEPMLSSEVKTLHDCESKIATFSTSFVGAGTALAVLRDGRLYRATHDTFDAYCRERWEFSPQRAGQLIKAAEVAKELAEHDSTMALPPPGNEGQVRPLTRLAKLEERLAVWQLASERAGANGMTAELVEKAIEELNLKAKSASSGTQPERVIDKVDDFSEFLTQSIKIRQWNPEQGDKLLKGLNKLRRTVENVEARFVALVAPVPTVE